jgi:hypothetical protein
VLAQEIARLDREVRVLNKLDEPEPQATPVAGLAPGADDYPAAEGADPRRLVQN